MNDVWTATTVTGIGATLAMDAWGLARRQLFGIPLNDYGMVGRWIAWMGRGRFFHSPIAKTPAMPGERLIGWTTHYAIGIGFAAALVGMAGPGWLAAPTPLPALAFGIVTVAAPLLVMQPAMGAGIAASRTPRPSAARFQSFVNHLVYGLGLYASALAFDLLSTI